LVPALHQAQVTGKAQPRVEFAGMFGARPVLGWSNATINARLTIPFSVTGTSSEPSIKPDVKGAAKETLQQYTKDPSKAIDAAKGIMDLFNRKKQQ
jgi:Holliday junction resolvase